MNKMPFNSFVFILLFLPLTITFYFGFNKINPVLGKIVLLIASGDMKSKKWLAGWFVLVVITLCVMGGFVYRYSTLIVFGMSIMIKMLAYPIILASLII